MSEKQISVTGIGNAIIDIIAGVDDRFLDRFNLTKGSMKLICEQEAADLQAKIKVKKVISGGSVANTIAGLAILGNKVAFIGKVKNDDLGNAFEEDLKKLGIIYCTKKAEGDHPPTACCIVLSTPDAARTMNTFLGVAGMLYPEDIDT
ncbi:MAG: adenosine kinase, partial [Actinobacteria bacterium]|nr:adenosine kinase [Actinomycetota bacterium]